MDTYDVLLMNNYFLISFVQNKFIWTIFSALTKNDCNGFLANNRISATCGKFTSDISNVLLLTILWASRNTFITYRVIHIAFRIILLNVSYFHSYEGLNMFRRPVALNDFITEFFQKLASFHAGSQSLDHFSKCWKLVTYTFQVQTLCPYYKLSLFSLDASAFLKASTA